MEQEKSKFYQALSLVAIVASFLLVTKIVTEIKGYRFIGGGVAATNTISVSGDADIYASPDIATISFTVRAEDGKVAAAQTKVSTKVAAALAAMSKLGVEDRDIKTEYYNSYPKYEWQDARKGVCADGASYCPPVPGRQVVVGYEVSQQVSVKVRNIDSVNAVVESLATAGVTEMQGPNFAIDDEDGLKADARKQAIENAREKAEVLAKDLGVTLVRIVSFSENDGGRVYYSKTMMEAVAPGMGGAPAPELPKGEQKITSYVTVTYEIR